MNVDVLINSLVLVLVATPLALVLGGIVALAAACSGHAGRRVVVIAALLTLVMPPFFVAGMWMEWIGFAGAWKLGEGWITERALPLAASTVALASLYWPVATMMFLGVWDLVETRSVEAEPRLRDWRLLAETLWPAARREAWRPAAILAILISGNFGIPALFQARVWSAEAWVEYATRFDGWAAWRQCWPMSVGLLLLLAWLGRHGWVWSFAAWNVTGRIWKERVGVPMRVTAAISTLVIVTVSLGVPALTALARTRTWAELVPAISASAPAAVRTVVYSATAAALAMLVGHALAGRRGGALTVIPFAVPGVFTGIAVAALASWGGFGALRETGAWVIFGLVIRYSFVGWLVSERSWRAADPRLRGWLSTNGGGRWATWRHVLWPVSPWSVAGGWYLVYVLCLWDVETQILVVPPGGDTLSMIVFNLLHYGRNSQLTALSLELGLVAALPLVAATVFRGLRGRGRSVWAAGLLAGWACGTCGCSKESASETRSGLDSTLFDRVEVIGGKGTGPGSFSKPRSVAVDAEGRVFVVDMTGRVQRFSREGGWQAQWQMPETTAGRPKGMDAAPDGGLFLVEPHYHRVNRFDADGHLLSQWGVQGTNVGQVWFPRAIAVGKDGTCYVSEYGRQERVQRFRWEDGTCLGSFGDGGTADGQLNRAEGLGIAPDGNVHVADSCNHRIQVFSPEGRWLKSYGGPGRGLGQLSYPYDVRVDRDGRRYVCEFGNSRVQVFGPDDRPLEMLGGPGGGPTALNNPWSVCLDAEGNLFVADSLNHRVVRYVRRKDSAHGGARSLAGRAKEVGKG